MQHFTRTAYHPQCNGQTERYNRSFVTRLRHYVSKHQDDWDRFVQILTYAYNMQVHRSSGFTPFQLLLTRVPVRHSKARLRTEDEFTTASAASDQTDQEADVWATRYQAVSRVRTMVGEAAAALRETQRRYKIVHDRRLRFRVKVLHGDLFYVDRPPSSGGSIKELVTGVPRSKLRSKTTVPYPVQSVSGSKATVMRDVIPDTISVHCVTVSPAARRRTPLGAPRKTPNRTSLGATTPVHGAAGPATSEKPKASQPGSAATAEHSRTERSASADHSIFHRGDAPPHVLSENNTAKEDDEGRPIFPSDRTLLF